MLLIIKFFVSEEKLSVKSFLVATCGLILFTTNKTKQQQQ